MSIPPVFLDELRASGLTDATVAAAGIHVERDPARIRAALNWATRGPWQHGHALAFPFLDANGEKTAYTRYKLGKPRTSKDKTTGAQKVVKYESPKGQRNHAYFPPGFASASADPAAPTLLTEGEKKALALAQHTGFPVIGLTGVWAFALKRERDENGKATGDRKLLPELEALSWHGRKVFIVFDSDARHNPEVRRAETALADELAKRGAIVRVIRLPDGTPGPDGTPKKQGADDYLLVHSVEDFAELMEQAADATAMKGDTPAEPNEAPDDPHRLARGYLDESCRHADGLTLRFHADAWKRWDGSRYVEVPDAELRAELTASAKRELDRINLIAQELAAAQDSPPPPAQKIVKGLISNIENALASLAILPAATEAPAWFDGGKWTRRNHVAMENGILDLDSLFAGKPNVLLQHSPRWFATTCLPYRLDLEADCPRWLAFLAKNLEGDTERIALLGEWFGYCLTPDASRQKFLVLEGEGANGKSVICAALEAMLGTANVAHVPLECFADRFQLTPTIGKLANICAEVGELDKAAEGILKAFAAGDPMQLDRKHKPPIQATPTARLVLATNNRPRFSDRSGGLWRRMILMPLRVTIADDDPLRVHGFSTVDYWRDSGELPGLFAWALAGLDRLRTRGHFAASEVCEAALTEYRIESNPCRMFLMDHCRADPDGLTPCEAIYRTYRDWCAGNGYAPLGDRTFGKEVKRAFPKAERRKLGPAAARIYAYVGVSTTT